MKDQELSQSAFKKLEQERDNYMTDLKELKQKLNSVILSKSTQLENVPLLDSQDMLKAQQEFQKILKQQEVIPQRFAEFEYSNKLLNDKLQ